MNKKYAIGVDFVPNREELCWTEIGTGKEIATAIKVYPHGVMDSICLTGLPV